MGHREPTNLSVIRSRVISYTQGSPGIQEKEKSRLYSVSKSIIHPKEDPPAKDIYYIGVKYRGVLVFTG
jgi:hypothetical protein